MNNDKSLTTRPDFPENAAGDRNYDAIDWLYLVLAALPLVAGIVLKVLTTPASDGIDVTGALIYFTIPMPFQDLPITEAQVNSWLVMISIFFLCRWLTRGLTVRGGSTRQIIAEMIVESTDKLVDENMGAKYFAGFSPFIAAVMGLSAFSSLVTLLGLFPPTSDFNVIAGWSLIVFVLITYYKCKCGFGHYVKSFGDPVPLLAPLNVISEVATPLSMTFRHYGNVLSGVIIEMMVGAVLGSLSKLIVGWLPGVFGEFPLLGIGIPAVLSVYFDIFSGLLQAFIFAMLTMLYISGGFPADDWEKLKAKKAAKKSANPAQKAA